MIYNTLRCNSAIQFRVFCCCCDVQCHCHLIRFALVVVAVSSLLRGVVLWQCDTMIQHDLVLNFRCCQQFAKWALADCDLTLCQFVSPSPAPTVRGGRGRSTSWTSPALATPSSSLTQPRWRTGWWRQGWVSCPATPVSPGMGWSSVLVISISTPAQGKEACTLYLFS